MVDSFYTLLSFLLSHKYISEKKNYPLQNLSKNHVLFICQTFSANASMMNFPLPHLSLLCYLYLRKYSCRIGLKEYFFDSLSDLEGQMKHTHYCLNCVGREKFRRRWHLRPNIKFLFIIFFYSFFVMDDLFSKFLS